MGRTILAALGAVGAAAGSALCCAGPLVAVTLGLSGAGLATTFEPLRPYFVAGAFGFLAVGFVMVQREEKKACEPGKPCASPAVRRWMKRALWIAAGLVALLATFPWWSAFLLS